ncbi:Cytochrome P450 3A24 [Trichoplax sp. H2]|nr:Cytochrome P450 3A24 [Trichoplax sp. H2]|eukprot:RDD42460.1 Cytochrome P450 3A24 [Trichoplax sp. H2]
MVIEIANFLCLPQSILGKICLIFLCIAACILWYVYTSLIAPYRRLTRLGIDVPKPKLIVGNVTDFGPGNGHIAQLKRLQMYGNIYGTLFFKVPAIWFNDPEMLRTVMVKEFSNFSNRYSLTKSLGPFSNSLQELKDDDWKRVRTILTTTFSSAKLKSIMPIIDNASDDLIQSCDDAIAKGLPVDFWRQSGKFSMSVILATVFGIEIESQEQEEKLTEAAATLFRSLPCLLQFLIIFMPSLFRILEPILGGKITYSMDYLTKTVKSVIKERRKSMVAGIPCRRDILQQMIEAGDNDKLSDDEIVSQAFVFLIAGYETTANTIAFASYLIATNPEIQRKLHDEIDSNCPDTTSVNYDTLNNLPYLEMTISETLRLYPAGYMAHRDVRKDTTINGIRIPKGIMAVIPIYAVHHNPQIWPNPEKFIPERFTPEEKIKHHPMAFIPFGGGPRNCIGTRLALLEVRAALVAILQNFQLLTVNETETPLQITAGSTLSPANGILLGLKRR